MQPKCSIGSQVILLTIVHIISEHYSTGNKIFPPDFYRQRVYLLTSDVLAAQSRGGGVHSPVPDHASKARYPCAAPTSLSPPAPSSCGVWAAVVFLVVLVIGTPFHEKRPCRF